MQRCFSVCPGAWDSLCVFHESSRFPCLKGRGKRDRGGQRGQGEGGERERKGRRDGGRGLGIEGGIRAGMCVADHANYHTFEELVRRTGPNDDHLYSAQIPAKQVLYMAKHYKLHEQTEGRHQPRTQQPTAVEGPTRYARSKMTGTHEFKGRTLHPPGSAVGSCTLWFLQRLSPRER